MKTTFLFVAILVSQLQPAWLSANDGVDRSQFAAKLSQVHIGDSELSVARLLGKPDDIVDRTDSAKLSNYTPLAWCYGTSGHLTFATLGCVCFDANNHVRFVYGNEGTPPSRDLIDERTLRELLTTVDKIGGVRGNLYNPLNMIRCVNRLRSESKERVLAVIEEHARVASFFSHTYPDGLLLLLRTIFEVSEEWGYMPLMGIGRMNPHLPNSKEMYKLFPRYPIFVVNDVPVLLISDYTCFGSGGHESLKLHMEYFRNNGVLRKTPLHPPDNPLRVFDILRSSKVWEAYIKLKRSDEEMVAGQLLRMLSAVPNAEHIYSAKLNGKNAFEDRWNKLTQDASSLNLRWDSRVNNYRRNHRGR